MGEDVADISSLLASEIPVYVTSITPYFHISYAALM